ncbi:hypothetical protein D1007_15735 [Hordeum vulgare]|nr:hypothetical protein D1007_15735 [Hordeum vulgare]
MVKGATVKAERAKKGSRGSSSGVGALSSGWIQGDSMSSPVCKGRMQELESEGLVVPRSWQLPEEGERDPVPRGDERALLVTHVERGFSMPPHLFFRAFLDFFGGQLHHLPP